MTFNLQPNPQFFQNNLPNQPCFVPQIPLINPDMQSLVPAITGLTMLNLQQRSNQGPHRAYIYNLMSEQAYQNQNFMGLIKFITDMADYSIHFQRMQPQQAIDDAVNRGVQTIMAARVLEAAPAFMAYLPANVMQDFQNIVGESRQLAGALENYRMSVQTSYPNQAMAYGGGMAMMPNMQVQNNRPSAYSYGNPATANPAMLATAMAAMPAQAPVNARTSRYDLSGIVEPAPVPASQPTQQVSRPVKTVGNTKWGISSSRSMEKEPAPAPVPTPAPAPTTETPAPSTVKSRPYDYVEIDGGVVMRPAFLATDWDKPTTDPTHPYLLAYDPSKYIMVHSRDLQGKILQHPIEWVPEMDYLKHELNEKLYGQEKARREVTSDKVKVYDWNLVRALTPKGSGVAEVDNTLKEGLDSGEMKVTDLKSFEPDVTAYITANDLKSGLDQADTMLRLEHREKLGGKTRELYFRFIKVVLAEDLIQAVQLDTLKTLQSLDDLHASMEEIWPNTGEVDEDESFTIVNDRITAAVNDALRDRMGLSNWNIDSFYSDWKDLLVELEKVYGDSYNKILTGEAGAELIRESLHTLIREDVKQYLKQTKSDLSSAQDEAEAEETETETETLPKNEETADGSDEICLFTEQVSVTILPIDRSEIEVDLSQGNLITPEYTPGLYDTLASILKRTTSAEVSYRHRYLLTRDRKLLEVCKGLLMDDAILLFNRGALN